MEGTCENNLQTPAPCVFELPGEPAVVINGVPDVITGVSSVDGNTGGTLCRTAADTNTEISRNTGFGVWLEGREVRKVFGESYYSGIVTEFDNETGWYRVVYEDGDLEDLEGHELQEVLQPLDITVPLKSLALKIIRKTQKSESARKGSGSRKRGAKAYGHRRPRGGSARKLTRPEE